jgi:hypothetical protein
VSRYQFSSIMMVLWAVLSRLETGVWRLVPSVVSTLYFVDALAALWKSRKERTP